jgi:RNA polymerase sigma-70 factor
LCPPPPQLESFSRLASQAYANGYAAHGDIGLQLEHFEERLRVVLEKRLGHSAPEHVLCGLFSSLHATDLYLTEACAQSTNAAWWRFEASYRKFINDVAGYIARSSDARSELVADVMAGLFLPDSSGKSSIASFDGKHSLMTWLRTVIVRRAINRKALKWNSFDSLDRPQDMPDNASISRIDAALRRGRYEAAVEDCFRQACSSLTDRERMILLLRYEQGLGLIEIAKTLALHRSRVIRGLHSAQVKLQKKIVSVLSAKYNLGPPAIAECVAEMLENPAHSLLMVLKQSEVTSEPRSGSARS